MTAFGVKRWRRVGIGSLCLIALGIIAVFQYLNFTGFCYSEWRYPSDQDLIDTVIRYEIDHISTYYLARGAKKYASVEEFHQLNPICCRVNKWGDLQFGLWRRRYVILRRVFGQEILTIELWYRFSDEEPNKFSRAYYLIDACGKVREGVGGGTGEYRTGPTRAWEGRL